jgi:nitroreductase
MVRSFDPEPVDPRVVDRLLSQAVRSPTAGNAAGTAWLVLDDPPSRSLYWECATTPEWREHSARWAGLSRAPVVLLALASPDAYVTRYAEADKATSGLGAGPDAWPVPYWFGDAAFGVMAVLLGAVDEKLGACFLGNFRNEPALLEAFGVPEPWRLFGTVLLGRPDGADHRSASLDRPAPEGRVRRGRWS